jgi:hypothetical protein
MFVYQLAEDTSTQAPTQASAQATHAASLNSQSVSPPSHSNYTNATPHTSQANQSQQQQQQHDYESTSDWVIQWLPERLQLPRFLPDLDDQSMNHVQQYVLFTKQDLYWSFTSDSLFVFGTILYVILCIWDWVWPPDPLDYDPDTYETLATKNYYAMDFMAPFIYMINATVDIVWANQVQEMCKVRRNMTNNWDGYRQQDKTGNQEAEPQLQPPRYTASTSSVSSLTYSDDYRTTGYCHDSGDYNDNTQSATDHVPWYRKCRKHTAHRRTLMAAGTFGLAAFFGVCSTLAYYWSIRLKDPNSIDHVLLYSDRLDTLADHTYILSAIFCITGKRTRPWLTWDETDPSCWSSIDFLEDAGDLLFLVGSLMDAVLGDLDMEQPIWLLTSSLLWLIDACLYLRSDMVLEARMKDLKESVDSVLV